MKAEDTALRGRIREHIFSLKDEKYKEFHGKLVPGNETIVGVRVPVLRGYAKELLKQYPAKKLLGVIADDCYEERLLQGMIIGLQPKPELETVLKQIREFVPKIDNWAVCDIFCAGLKITKKHKEHMFDFIREYIQSDGEFERRFGVVMLLDFYVEEAYLNRMFALLDGMDTAGYYVQMAVAWALSVCLVNDYRETLGFLDRCHLDAFTKQKAIQKACESRQILPQQKEQLRKKQAEWKKHIETI